jgi:hypothetical protein
MPGIYGHLVGYIKGILLVETTEIDTSLETPDEDVATLPLGWAGQSPGPRKRVTNFTCATPAAGFTLDLEAIALNAEEVECMIQNTGTGERCVSKGFLRNPKQNSGVGKSATLSFEHHGEPSLFT